MKYFLNEEYLASTLTYILISIKNRMLYSFCNNYHFYYYYYILELNISKICLFFNFLSHLSDSFLNSLCISLKKRMENNNK